MQYLLIKRGAITSSRNIDLMPPSYDIHKMKDRPGIMFSPNWKEVRHCAVRYLRGEGMGKSSLESRVVQEAEMFCQTFIEPNLDEEMALYKYFKLASSNIIFSMIFGERFDYSDEKLLENNRMMEILFESNMTAVMSKNIPFAKWIPGDPFQHRLNSECLEATMKYFDGIVAHRRAKMVARSNPALFVDNYLSHFMEMGTMTDKFLDRDMATTLMQLFGAGTDTSACYMNWAILFMCCHPEVQEKVQQEVDSYIKCTGERPKYSERSKLPYTEATILEVLRVSMMLPTLLPHSLDKPVTIEGHVIPANTELIFNLQSVYKDPDVFENPEEFDPERYLKGDIQTKAQYTKIAFGLGRRSCPGEPLARMEMFLFLTTILERYNFKHTGQKPTTTGICGTIHIPKQYSFICTRRNGNH
ncbi:cytochrome P450 2U1-like isoform X2 [Watersipora subatra]